MPTRAELDARFSGAIAGSYEEALDGARRFAREANFRVGVQIVDGAASAEQAGPALADIAECVIAGLLPRVEEELAAAAGRIPGSGFVVVAMGKLGGREMTASSDLDLVIVYDAPAGVEASDGPKPLSPTLYFARLAQRLIAALTTSTAAGTLYEVDMRLRPTGNKGPVAVSLKSFAEYHASESWTWEHMALTRGRLIAGTPQLQARVAAEIRNRLTQKGEPAAIIGDARSMRARMADFSRPQCLGSEICARRIGGYRVHRAKPAIGPCPGAATAAQHQHHRGTGKAAAGRGAEAGRCGQY